MKQKVIMTVLFMAVIQWPALIGQQIRLLDAAFQTPVEGAAFAYGSQQGITDADGIFKLDFQANADLKLNHLRYGSWMLTSDEVEKALSKGIIMREELVYSLSPVTIVAMHRANQNQNLRSLDTRDRLSHDGGDVLNQIDGFNSIRKSAAYGFDPVFRGFKYEQINLVLDGAQGCLAACPNRMDPPASQVAPNMIDRIEVLKGPHGLRYGSAFGATVNFIPGKPIFTENNDFNGRLTSSLESNGLISRNEARIGFRSQRFDLALFSSFSNGHDYKDGSGVEVSAQFMRASVGGMLAVKVSENQQLGFSVTRNFARDTDFPSLPMDLRKDDTWLLNGKHEIVFHDKRLKSWNTTVYASLVDHLMDNLLKVIEPRTMNASTPAKTHSFGGRSETVWQSNRLKGFAGFDLKLDKADGTRERSFIAGLSAGKVFYDNVWQEGQILKAGAFAEVQLSFTILHLVAAGRLDFNQSDIHNVAPLFEQLYSTTASQQLNPSISVGVKSNSHGPVSLGIWLGSASRSGSMTERFINFFPVGLDAYELVGNPELKPETNNQADVQLGFQSDKTYLGADLYVSIISNYISSEIDTALSPMFPTSPGVRKFINIDQAMRTGFEFSWKQQIFNGLQHKLSVAYTYALNRLTDEPLPEIPPFDFRFVLNGSFCKERLKPMLSFRHVLDQNRISVDYGETKTPAFSLADVQLSWKFSGSVTATAGVQNLFDETYYEHLNRTISGLTPREIYAPGRNFFLTLSLDL